MAAGGASAGRGSGTGPRFTFTYHDEHDRQPEDKLEDWPDLCARVGICRKITDCLVCARATARAEISEERAVRVRWD